jgi:hypothetical protein
MSSLESAKTALGVGTAVVSELKSRTWRSVRGQVHYDVHFQVVECSSDLIRDLVSILVRNRIRDDVWEWQDE